MTSAAKCALLHGGRGCCSESQPATDLSLAGLSQVSPWPDVIHELQTGVRLRKAAERPRRRVSLREQIRSPYEILLDDIQHRRYTLRKVSDLGQQTTLETLALLCFWAVCVETSSPKACLSQRYIEVQKCLGLLLSCSSALDHPVCPPSYLISSNFLSQE